MLLTSIDDAAVQKYRATRSAARVIRHGKLASTSVSQTAINKEVGALRKVLGLARKNGIHDKITSFPMENEPSRKRRLTTEEYHRLLQNCPIWLRRLCETAYETSPSRSDLLGLTWSQIDMQPAIIERERNKTAHHEVEHVIPIATPELWEVLGELQSERRRIPNASGLVFTLDGQPIPENLFEYWFRKACRTAGIKNFRFHHLRHCAISRWAAAGIPTAAAMLAAGHASVASDKKYQNLQRQELKSAFDKLSPKCPEEIRKERKIRASD